MLSPDWSIVDTIGEQPILTSMVHEGWIGGISYSSGVNATGKSGNLGTPSGNLQDTRYVLGD